MFDKDSVKEVTLIDTHKDRQLKKGSRVKLCLSDVQVTEGTLILEGSLI